MKKIIKLAILALLIFNISCDDIIEENIENDIIITTFPGEGSIIDGNTVQFSWQEIDGADNYRVQILTENQITVIDSLITSSNISFILNEGNYSWRVKGVNFAYSTQYNFPINFSVELSEDLTNQTVQLLTPTNNKYTNESPIILTWSQLENIESYSIEILKEDNGLQTIFQSDNLVESNFILENDLISDNTRYNWKVKAVNNNSETNYSENTFFIDNIVPNQPELIFPDDTEILTNLTVNFNWTLGVDNGIIESPRSSKIQISTNINFSTLLASENLSDNFFQFSFEEEGTYYWRVLVFDEAGNVGEYSVIKSVIIE